MWSFKILTFLFKDLAIFKNKSLKIKYISKKKISLFKKRLNRTISKPINNYLYKIKKVKTICKE